jgi:phytoene desaturase
MSVFEKRFPLEYGKMKRKGGVPMAKKVTVIGGGVAGLTSAIRLQHDGYDVTLYEARDQLGGKMGRIERDGFLFDLGPTIVMMPDQYKEVFTYCDKNPDDYIQMRLLDNMFTLHYPDGDVIEASSHLPTLFARLEERGEDVGNGFLSYLQDTHERYVIAKRHFLERSFRKPSDFYHPKMLYHAWRLKTLDTAQHTIERHIKDEKIQQYLSFHILYIGASPYTGPSIYTIIPMIEALYGVWYIQGGMYAYVEALTRLFLEEGGTIQTSTPVDEILFNDRHEACGVRIGDTSIDSDIVVCNADFPHAMKHLIPSARYKGKYTDKKLDKMAYSCSVMILYLGLDKQIDTLDVHNLYFANDYKQNLDDIFEGRLPMDFSFYLYVPSRIDESVAPEGHESIYVLVPVPERGTATFEYDEATIDSYQEHILNRLEQVDGLSDLRNHLVTIDRYTPPRFERELRAYRGATFGLAPTLLQSNYFRPKNVHPYAKNLYFAGSSVHPGAGVPIAILSGNIVHAEVNQDHKI